MTRDRKPSGHPHPFVADPDVPPDHLGRQACRCGLIGTPGDSHHDMPAGPAEDARSLAAGEKEGA